MVDLTEIWRKNSVMPVIVVDSLSGKVVMLRYMNKEAFAYTLKTHKAWYCDMDGTNLRKKGDHSGHEHKLISLKTDYSCKALLMTVEQTAHQSGSNTRFVHTIFGTEEDTQKRYKFGKVDVDENFDFSKEDYDDFYEDE